MRSRKPRVLAGIMFVALMASASRPQTATPKPATSTAPAAPAPANSTDTSSASSSSSAAKPAGSAKDNNAPKAAPLTPLARLTAARTVFIKKTSGSDIPVSAISDGIQGWGRYVIVGSPEKADLVLEVESPENTSGLTLATSERTSKPTGEPDRSSSTTLSKQTVSSEVKLTVRDAKSGMLLWSTVDQAKSSVRRVNRENSLVEAGERLFVRFHDKVEPPARVVP